MLCRRGLNFLWEHDRSEGVSADTEGSVVGPAVWVSNSCFLVSDQHKTSRMVNGGLIFFFFTNNRHGASLPMI